MWITKTSINQPVFATMVMFALVVLGVFAYNRLPVEQMPDVTVPVVFIQLEYPGAAPEAIENDLIKPIENVVNTVSGVKRIYGTAREGVGWLSIEFRLDVDVTAAAQEVRDKVADLQPSFPREAKTPRVSRTQADENSSPVINLAVYSETRPLRELSTLTEQVIVKRLQSAAGVGNVTTSGSVERQIQVFLKPEQLRSYGIGVDEVIAAIQAANQDLPAGSIRRGATEQLVRIEGRIKEPAEFGRIIVATRGSAVYLQQGGVPIHLDQVAEVVDGEAEETSRARLNGKPSLSLNVFKIQGANVVNTAAAVQDALVDLKKRLPEDVQIVTIYSNAEWVKGSLDSVKRTILEGGLLTVLIVFLFLHSWRSTIITGLTLPISVIATFIVVYAMGFTLNFLTLMALSLCIGLLIDDAIVVRENIVRHLNMGKSHLQAAREGTEEIGLAVMATTFAILAVFVPVAFMSGIIGKFFFQFGITVAVAVLVSLFVSFTLDPMLSAVWRDPPKNRFKYLPWLGRLMERIERGVDWLHEVYGRTLDWALQTRRRRAWFPLFGLTHAARTLDWRQIGTISNRGIVLWTAAVIFFGSFLLVPLIGTEFFPEDDDGFTSLRINTPIGSSLEYTDAKTRQVEEALKAFPEIELVDTQVGTEDGRNYARLNLKLTDVLKTKRRPQQEIEKAIRDRVAQIAGLEMSVGFNKPIFVSILGPDATRLTEISQLLMAKMAKIPGIADLESSEKGANPTVAVRINRELASDLGLSNERIGRALRPLVAGDQISYWLGPDGQNYEVIARLPQNQRQIASDLGELYLTSNRLDGQGLPLLVPLKQVAEFVETTSPEQIKRQDLERRISLYAGAEGRPAGDVGNDVKKLMKEMEDQLPPGYRFDVGGQQQDMEESFAAALAALGLAVIFIYIILASQFGSFLQPLAIMASLPLSLAGVFIALMITGTTLNLFSIIGFIMLMGLVTKNAILLVDFTNQALREGKPLRQAQLDAGQVRLRPILMTTLAMIFGMLPMAIGAGLSGETNAAMGRAVIGGIITSSLLTLVVVPVLYTYLYALGERAKRWFGSSPDEEEATLPH
ncbi:efflux RND transporter permease subunit [Stagnimonas aquatica]|uniref:Efflux RND transporter permease subunit n=1 Tax=Stagnimonas aquatica TaxID=2689987 RepID=A0A3N0VE87_9GAMM|nr:efflux RND transporter permease subunit [Stagnimonas aquatica]ROH91087.1 efflux RND transporter permease subunit [Stagnimonas aquatica]